MVQIVGSILFTESADQDNRYAFLSLDSGIDTDWGIVLNGTDNNGEPVIPHFITIDNYNNSGALNYSIDNFSSSVAPYTTIVLAINPSTSRLIIHLTTGQMNVYISEKRLPITEGLKYNVTATSSGGGGGGGGVVTKYQFITAGSTFTVPADWNRASNKIHCIGAGANGLAGSGAGITGQAGGGGAYARRNNVPYNPGQVIACIIPAGNAGNSCQVQSSSYLVADSALTDGSGNGGSIVQCVGDVKYNGGSGNSHGSGGAAGPNGAGGDGTGTSGGDGNNSLNGGGSGSISGTPGGNGTTFTQTSDGTKAGSGGGAGNPTVNNTAGTAGGKYGAGGSGGRSAGFAGGAGQPGIIILEWTP